MLAKQWLNNTRSIMERIENTQMENIQKAAEIMADSIQAERWVHTFGCGHSTLPIEEMYPRIGGFVGFHPIIEMPLTFFTNITGQMGVHQFIFLERAEGYGVEIMKGYNFDKRDTMWLFSHTGVNSVNIDVALEAKKKGMKLIVYGSAAQAKGKVTKHPSHKNLFELADVVVDTCALVEDASVPLKNHVDKIGPVSTMAFITCVWMTVTTVAEILAHKEGKWHVILATIIWISLTIVLYFLLFPLPYLFWPIAVILFLLCLWVFWFFRIPKRTFTEGDNWVIAPADGKVVVIEDTFESEYFKDKRLQVSIFMSPMDVHVNRSPITGKAAYVKYHPGKYLVAWHPKSSTENERTTVVIENNNITLLLRQIAGAMARRIKCYVQPGDIINQNNEFGFIRFGSRVDVFFPVGTKIEVKIGQKVKGGQTILAKL